MSEELKPCPFCGYKLVGYLLNSPICAFKCDNPYCGAIVYFDNSACNLFPEKAVTHWNRRANNE